MKTLLLLIWMLVAKFALAQAPQLPIFDAHMHYNIEAWEYLPPEKLFALFKANNVTSVLANSRPNEGSWTLLKQPQFDVAIVPFVRVYRDRDDYGTWFAKPEVYAHIVAELNREPRAKGIGEFHLSGEQGAHPGVEKIVNLAQSRGLWLHAHVDDIALKHILKIAPNAKMIWAHTGFTTPLDIVTEILKTHPNVVGELSYRWDVAGSGTLNPAWKSVFTQFPERFVVGSDTWVNQRWEGYAETMRQYRAWLAELPTDVAKKIAHENGERLFGVAKK
jgi:predicted TIM-barrel fold metal-dependent hydrolase